MTLKELSQLYYLNREIEIDQQRLEFLKNKALSPSSPNLSGMPKSNNYENQLERYNDEIADLEAIISAKLIQIIHERNRLERYIAEITDSLTRQIFTLRFINGFSWEQVAAHIGSHNTAKNLSNICYRYIDKHRNQSYPH